MTINSPSTFKAAMAKYVSITQDFRTVMLADENRLREQACQFLQAFEGTAEIAYSVKALLDSELLYLWKQEGIHHFEVSSVEDASATLEAVPDASIIFGNPFKTPFQIARALELGISHFVVDSTAQIDDLVDALSSGAVSDPITLSLRIKPIGTNSEALCSFTEKFGIPSDQVTATIAVISDRIPTAKIGLSIHVGTGTRDPNVFETEIANLWKIARENGVTEFINIGGGYPIVYPGIDDDLDIQTFLRRVSVEVANQQREYSVDTVITEPGRALVGDAISGVLPILESRLPQGIVINDGLYNTFVSAGIHSIFPHAQIYRQSAGTWTLLDTPNERQTVWGITCDGKDHFETYFPSGAQKGDCLVIHGFGAYTAAAAGSHFNGLGYVPNLFFFNH